MKVSLWKYIQIFNLVSLCYQLLEITNTVKWCTIGLSGTKYTVHQTQSDIFYKWMFIGQAVC